MKKQLTIDMTSGKKDQPSAEILIRLRVPVVADDSEEGSLRVSLDHSLEMLRQRMKEGTAAKIDEDQLVIFRLLQAAGIEYWPIRQEDVAQ